MKLTSEQAQELIEMQEAEVNPKHTGWTRKIRFNRWTKYGKDRLYYSITDYDRKGKNRNHYTGKGYIDLQSGEVTAPPSERIMLKGLIEA
jgi:hypothetical protein